MTNQLRLTDARWDPHQEELQQFAEGEGDEAAEADA